MLLAIAAAVGLGVHAAGRLLVRRLLWLPQRSAAPYGGATGRRLARGWACLSAAIGLFTANAILDFPETLLGFRLAVIFVAAWGLDTAWALKAGEQDALKTPLAPLFWLYALGNILQAMDINLALLALAWPFALLPAAAAMRRRFNAPYPLLEKGLCGVSAAVCALSAAGCVLGYSLLSFFASLTWFLLAIGIQLGMAIGKFFAAWVEGLREGEDEIAKAIVIGLGVPLLWLAILSVVAVWASDRLMSAEMLFALMNSELSILGMDFTAVSLVAAVFLFFVVRTMNRLMCAALDRMYGGSIEQGVVPSLKTLLFYGFAGAYALFALKALGVSLFNIALVAGGLSVGVGFGLQYLVNNFISGLIILFGRSLQHGDIIEVDGRQARVEKISIRETVVRTWRNAVVSIPNTEILNSKLVNWSRNNRRVRLELPVGVAYGSDLQAACQAALAAVAATPRVLTTPAPSILLSNFGASSIDLTVRVWVEDIAQDVIILSDLRIAIERAFREAGVSIPFNQLDVHIVR